MEIEKLKKIAVEEKGRFPLRILHVLVLNVDSGVASIVMNLYRNIDRSRIQFDFITWGTDEKSNYISEVQGMGGKVYKITGYKKDFFTFKKEAKSVLEKNHFDGIHCHEYLVNIPFLYWAQKAGISLRIAHSHNPTIDSFLKRNLTIFCRGLFRKYATDFIACSKESGEFLFGKKSRYLILKNGIDVKKYLYSSAEREKTRKELGIEEKFIIGTIGRMVIQKNQEFLLDVFKEIADKSPKTDLVLVGKGELLDKLREKVEKLKITEKVHFLGVRKDIPTLLNAMDVFMLPSLYEGLGIVLVEAQANGLPCIASDTIPKEVKLNDNFQFLSLKEDKEAWVKAVLQEIQQKRGREKEKVSLSQFNIRYSAQMLEKEYLNNIK